jgi:hypothetical protein
MASTSAVSMKNFMGVLLVRKAGGGCGECNAGVECSRVAV